MSFSVRRMRLELTRSCDHYPLKVACIPISPPARSCANAQRLVVPRTGLEPAHLAACAPETHASTNSAIWARACINTSRDSRQAARLRLRIVLRFFGLQNYVLHPEVYRTLLPNGKKKERKTRLELATPTLARLCSTN